jgi:hypothetical protein
MARRAEHDIAEARSQAEAKLGLQKEGAQSEANEDAKSGTKVGAGAGVEAKIEAEMKQGVRREDAQTESQTAQQRQYLKHTVLMFMQATEEQEKLSLLPVLGTLLHFDPADAEAAKAAAERPPEKRGWFG